jgi:ribosomal protein S18 acetylase RimI-like enzyme
MKMRIKEISKKDIPRINELEKKVFRKNAFTKKLLTRLMNYSLMFVKLIKEDQFNQIIGFIIIVEDDKKQANLANFLIDPEYQNKGYGRIFLEKTLSIFKNKFPRYQRIILNVKTTNEIAIRLYKKLGFEIKKEIPFYYRSGDSSFLMELYF